MRLVLALFMVCATGQLVHADLVRPEHAYEAAATRGACHWMVDLKDKFTPRDSVQIAIVDAQGKQLWGGILPSQDI